MRLLASREGNVCVSDQSASRIGGAVHEAASLWDGVLEEWSQGQFTGVCKTRKLTMGGEEKKNQDEPQGQALG